MAKSAQNSDIRAAKLDRTSTAPSPLERNAPRKTYFGHMIDHFRTNIFASIILVMHLGAAVESLLRGDPLRVMYFSGGSVLTMSVILMSR